MKITTLNSLVVTGLLSVTAHTAFCQGTIYFSRPDFQAALNSSTTITFEDVPSSTLSGGLGYWSVTNHGVIFSNPGPSLYVADPNGDFHPIPGTGKYLWNFDGGYPVSILLPAGVTAFGADFSGGIEPYPSFNATLTVNLAGGGSYAYNFSAPRNSWTFFGVTFAQPLSSLVYRDAGPPDGQLGGPLHEEMLDNVTFGNVVPEPSMPGLFALCGLLLAARRCRVRNHRGAKDA